MGNRIQICSIASKKFEPDGFRIRRGYNWATLFIPGCEEGQEYTSLFVEDHVMNKVHHDEYDASKAILTPFEIPAATIVQDFFSTELIGLKGCFVPAGEIPTSAELAKARQTRKAYLLRLVGEGDIEWSRSGSVVNITGEAKRACAELGIDNDWANLAPAETFECPACGEKLRVGVALCKSCGAILDRDKAAKFGLLESSVPTEPKKRMGRPPKAKPVTQSVEAGA
jgi:predicted RNA-binding Zn-ribbon protein involved in translation (DUF1610 family)